MDMSGIADLVGHGPGKRDQAVRALARQPVVDLQDVLFAFVHAVQGGQVLEQDHDGGYLAALALRGGDDRKEFLGPVGREIGRDPLDLGDLVLNGVKDHAGEFEVFLPRQEDVAPLFAHELLSGRAQDGAGGRAGFENLAVSRDDQQPHGQVFEDGVLNGGHGASPRLGTTAGLNITGMVTADRAVVRKTMREASPASQP